MPCKNSATCSSVRGVFAGFSSFKYISNGPSGEDFSINVPIIVECNVRSNPTSFNIGRGENLSSSSPLKLVSTAATSAISTEGWSLEFDFFIAFVMLSFDFFEEFLSSVNSVILVNTVEEEMFDEVGDEGNKDDNREEDEDNDDEDGDIVVVVVEEEEEEEEEEGKEGEENADIVVVLKLFLGKR